MKFEWDEAKNRANIRKHGMDFRDAEQLFQGILLAEPDTREDYGSAVGPDSGGSGIGSLRLFLLNWMTKPFGLFR